MAQVGVVGLGGMGLALADALLAAGHHVLVFDLRAEAVAAACRAGASGASSGRDLAERSDLVMTFLPGPEQVLDVALNPATGVLSGLRPDAALLDLSTCGPDVAATLGQSFDQQDRRFFDCPVSRKAPDMTVLVGGVAGCLGGHEDILMSVSRSLVYCGRRGAGYATKLLNQHVKYSWYLASAEALLVAEALGLDASEVADAIQQCSGGLSGLEAASKFFRDDEAGMRTHAPASTIRKDAALAEVMSYRAGVRVRSLEVVVDFFQAVAATDYRDRPYPESSELLRSLRAMPEQNGPRS